MIKLYLQNYNFREIFIEDRIYKVFKDDFGNFAEVDGNVDLGKVKEALVLRGYDFTFPPVETDLQIERSENKTIIPEKKKRGRPRKTWLIQEQS